MNLFKSQDERELKALARRITKASDPVSLGSASKRRLKKRLFAVVEEQSELREYAGLIAKIIKVAEKVKASNEARWSMRRRVLNYISIDLGSFSFLDVCRKGLFGRTSVAVAMIFVFSFVSIFTFDLNTPIAHAKDSKLVSVDGDVYVYRDGMLQIAHDGFAIKEGDKIHTGYDSSATAIFMDDSLSRIASESKINVQKLYSDPYNFASTEVVIGLNKGRIWTKVTSLIEGSFNVATLHTLATADRSATFDVAAVDKESSEISVVENFVNVELSSYSPAVETTVVEGESLIVEGTSSMIVNLDEKDEWLRMNKSKDEFESQLIAQEDSLQREKDVGALPNDKMYKVKMLKENLGGVLSIGEREKLQNQLVTAEKRLAEAEFLIKKGLSGTAEDVLKEYKQIMFDLTRAYPDLIGIAEVEEELSSMLARDKRRYYTTLPGSSLYDVKEVVGEVELLLANDRTRSNQIALNQASDGLYQIFDLVEHGGEAVAEISIEGYTDVVASALENLDRYSQNDKKDYSYVALDTVLSDIKTLNALEEMLSDSELDLDVSITRDAAVEQIQEYLTSVNEDGFYDDMVVELENLTADLDELVELSEFTGINEENAATVSVEVERKIDETDSAENS
ncbi:FecR domain-containing protein [Candidatus Peregrinibacteria bacterium]|nr:FecR domain-containing protein [Candidatus Peregrinibacteria bacterium]